MAKKKPKHQKECNYVAKYAKDFCHATIETDRKKEFKKGSSRKQKYKGKGLDSYHE